MFDGVVFSSHTQTNLPPGRLRGSPGELAGVTAICDGTPPTSGVLVAVAIHRQPGVMVAPRTMLKGSFTESYVL